MTIELLFYKPEFYYWFLIPTIIAFFVCVKSIIILTKKRSLINWILTILIFGLVVISEYILCIIFFMNAWPTYMPYIGISLALIFYGTQYLINRRQKILNEKI